MKDIERYGDKEMLRLHLPYIKRCKRGKWSQFSSKQLIILHRERKYIQVKLKKERND